MFKRLVDEDLHGDMAALHRITRWAVWPFAVLASLPFIHGIGVA